MKQYKYEVRGYYFEKESGQDMKVDFVCFTLPCPNSYVAKLYVIGKLKEHEIVIKSIARVIE